MAVINQLLETIQTKMYTTSFDADNKVWYGPKCESKIDKHENFGEIILAKLSDTDGDRISQVNSK